MARKMNGRVVREALQALGTVWANGPQVEITILGGAAAMLTELLPPALTTGDVDAIGFRPHAMVEAVLHAAERVARRLEIPRGWLTTDAGLFSGALPYRWQSRRERIGDFGHISVYALDRKDLIAMKFYAHRAGDLEHLERMAIRRSDLEYFFSGCAEGCPTGEAKSKWPFTLSPIGGRTNECPPCIHRCDRAPPCPRLGEAGCFVQRRARATHP